MGYFGPARILVVGAKGRLGSEIVQAIPLASSTISVSLAGETGRGDRIEDKIGDANVVIDVSHHSGTAALVSAAQSRSLPLVIGTTGHDESELALIRVAAAKIPVVLAPNFSIGVNVLLHLTRKAAEVLKQYDQEVVEMHHRNKLDAPSGTAKRLAEVLCEVKGRSYVDLVKNGRNGDAKRSDDEIGMHALRGGGVIGDHTVIFATGGERVELSHRAGERRIFAVGAIHAANWALEQQQNQKPGLYSMQDVLGLK